MTDAPIPGWYPDPRNSDVEWRWWNGRDWTHETSPRRAPEAAAPVRRAQDWGWDAPAAAPTAGTAPVSANTPWIWLLAFSIYIYGTIAGILQGVGLFFVRGDTATSSLVGAGALVVALIPLVVIADRDGRALRKRGLPAPSSLWVILLAPLVYFAVRARKLKKVGARSRGPEIALLIVVLLQIVGAAASVYLALAVLPSIPGGPSLF